MQTYRNSIIDEIKHTFKKGNMLTRIIYINLGIYLAVVLIEAFSFFFKVNAINPILEWLAVPADLNTLMYKPWTVFSYMFLHEKFFHILFNLLWLFWFGKIFLEYFTGKQLLNVYIIGGLSGAALYILAFNTLPAFNTVVPISIALGASASVYAIVVAAATYVPNYTIHLMFIGPVKIKYIAIVSLFLDLIFLKDGNAGGHIAHIGGAILGFYYGTQIKKGNDITKFFGKLIDSISSIFKKKQKLKVTHRRKETDMEYNKRKATEQKDIDSILEKISKSGYQSLTNKEKDMLFRQSRKN